MIDCKDQLCVWTVTVEIQMVEDSGSWEEKTCRGLGSLAEGSRVASQVVDWFTNSPGWTGAVVRLVSVTRYQNLDLDFLSKGAVKILNEAEDLTQGGEDV